MGYMEELQSAGCSIGGCDSNGNVCWTGEPQEELAHLVWVAHEQPLSSDECVALQAAISEDAWLAYTECRKAPVKAARAVRYTSETDPLLLSALETALKTATATNGEITVVLSETAATEWLNAKDAVRTENPYPL